MTDFETPRLDEIELNLLDQFDDDEADWTDLLKRELEEAFPAR
jgi:hypothetical protein